MGGGDGVSVETVIEAADILAKQIDVLLERLTDRAGSPHRRPAPPAVLALTSNKPARMHWRKLALTAERRESRARTGWALCL